MKVSDLDLDNKYTYASWINRYPILNRYIRLYAIDHRGLRKSFEYDALFTWEYFLYYYLEDSELSANDKHLIWYKGDLSPLVALEEKRANNFQQLYTAIDAKVEDSVDFILSLTQN